MMPERHQFSLIPTIIACIEWFKVIVGLLLAQPEKE
jgi:hypothetical protein